jgi:hypothetical protein
MGIGDGTFDSVAGATTAPDANSVVAADFTGDGKIDLATGSSEAVISVLPGNGDGTFKARVTTSTDDGGDGAPYRLVTGDFNNDGKADIVGNGSSFRFSMLNGTASTATTFVGAGGNTLQYAGDLSGDSTTDIGAQSGSTIRLNLISNGASTASAFLGSGGGTLF